MISERKLVASHTSFWRLAMPMGEAFVRDMNAELRPFLKKHDSLFAPGRQSLISEFSFRLFCAFCVDKLPLESDVVDSEETLALANSTRAYICRLEKGKQIDPLTREERLEAITLAARLKYHFTSNESSAPIVPHPLFPGCGIVDDCEGDLLVGTTLYEVKNVEREFRLIDIRQLLVYSALNFAARQYRIEAIALVNARMGCFYRCRLDTVAMAACGAPAFELLSSIMSYISGDKPSR